MALKSGINNRLIGVVASCAIFLCAIATAAVLEDPLGLDEIPTESVIGARALVAVDERSYRSTDGIETESVLPRRSVAQQTTSSQSHTPEPHTPVLLLPELAVAGSLPTVEPENTNTDIATAHTLAVGHDVIQSEKAAVDTPHLVTQVDTDSISVKSVMHSSAATNFAMMSVNAERGASSKEEPIELPPGSVQSVYSAFEAAPKINQQKSVFDGDDEQLASALEPPTNETTIKDRHINSYLTNPPDTKDDQLPLRDVIIHTLKNNPDIGITRWRVEDTRHAIRGAKAAYLPTVDFNGQTGIESTYSQGVGNTDPLNRRVSTLRITQRVFDFGRSSQGVKRAKALNQAQRLLHRDKVEDILLQTTSAYLDLLAVLQLLDNAIENVEAHEAIYRLVDISFKGGNTSEAEVKRAQSRLDRARTQQLDFENAKEAAINNFRRITGLEPGKLIEPQLNLDAAFRLTKEQIDFILADHPALQSILRDLNSLRHQLIASRRSHLPEFAVELTGKFQDNVLGATTWTSEGRAMLTATWNLYDGGLSSSRSRQIRARENENKQRLIKQRNALKEEAYNIVSVLKISDSKKAIFDEQVENSRRVVDLYSKQFQAGRRTLFELLDAQADLSKAIEESIANKYENQTASFSSLRLQNSLTVSLATQLGFDVEEIGSREIERGY